MLNMLKYAALMFLFRSHLILCDDGSQHKPQLKQTNDYLKSEEPLQRFATISPIVQRLSGDGNDRYRRSSRDAGMNFLRLYLCEAGYQNCMADERYFEVLDVLDVMGLEKNVELNDQNSRICSCFIVLSGTFDASAHLR